VSLTQLLSLRPLVAARDRLSSAQRMPHAPTSSSRAGAAGFLFSAVSMLCQPHRSAKVTARLYVQAQASHASCGSCHFLEHAWQVSKPPINQVGPSADLDRLGTAVTHASPPSTTDQARASCIIRGCTRQPRRLLNRTYCGTRAAHWHSHRLLTVGREAGLPCLPTNARRPSPACQSALD